MNICLKVDWQRRTVCLRDPLVGRMRFLLDLGRYLKVGGYDQMNVTMTDTQKTTATISPVDAKGNPAEVEGVPSWTVNDGALLTVIPSADGLAAEILAVGPLGTAQVKVVADADLGEGVTELVGILDIEIIAGQAVNLVVGTSAPEEQ